MKEGLHIATLKDIADKANVSITTVSNVVNGKYEKVSPACRARVEALLEKHNYVPNQYARDLSSKDRHIVAIIIQSDHMENALADAYTGEFVGEAAMRLQDNGYDPMIRLTSDFADINRILRKWKTAGVIFTGTYDKHIREVSEDTDIPFIFTDSYSSSRRINNVGIDDYKGGALAAEHLHTLGHRRIAFVAPGLYISEVDEQRRLGFAETLLKKGAVIQDELFIRSTENPAEIAETLINLSEPATAVFVTADRIAVQLIGALKSLKKSIPGDFSIVGFDNISIGQYTDPALTTIAQDIAQKAKLAVDILTRHIRNPSAPMENSLMDVKLIVRDSTRRLI